MAFFVWEESSHAVSLIGDGLIAAQARRTPNDPLLVRIALCSESPTAFTPRIARSSSRFRQVAGGERSAHFGAPRQGAA